MCERIGEDDSVPRETETEAGIGRVTARTEDGREVHRPRFMQKDVDDARHRNQRAGSDAFGKHGKLV